MLESWEKFLRDPELMMAMIILMVLMDLINMVVELRRNIRGHGPSGIPVIAVMFSVFSAASSREAVPISGSPRFLYKIFNIAILVALHSVLHYGIPIGHLWWIRRKSEQQIDA